jgi:MFS transporter, SP family, sugar:H+ symporter
MSSPFPSLSLPFTPSTPFSLPHTNTFKNTTTMARPPTEAGSSLPAILIGAFVAFGGVLFGYDTGTISGILAMDYWRALFSTGYVDSSGHPDVSPSQSSAIVSILSAGTFFGALASPFLGDTIGRRWGLIASSWVFILGVVLQTVATELKLFLAGRFFAGFGVGLISALSAFIFCSLSTNYHHVKPQH